MQLRRGTGQAAPVCGGAGCSVKESAVTEDTTADDEDAYSDVGGEGEEEEWVR